MGVVYVCDKENLLGKLRLNLYLRLTQKSFLPRIFTIGFPPAYGRMEHKKRHLYHQLFPLGLCNIENLQRQQASKSSHKSRTECLQKNVPSTQHTSVSVAAHC